MEKKITRLGTLSTGTFQAHLDRVTLRNNRKRERLWINYPQAVAIVPMVSSEEIILVKQWRYAVGKETLEIPAGKMDREESPEEGVRRELLEETGFEVKNLELIQRYYPAYGYSNEMIHLFLGTTLTRKKEISASHEISSTEILTMDTAMNLVTEGVIQDAKTIIGIKTVILSKKFGGNIS